MSAIITRNIKLYYRDRSRVIFSMFASLIMVVSYVLFIGPNMSKNMGGSQHTGFFVNRLLLSGVLSMTPVTTAVCVFSQMVRDRNRRVLDDFYISPIKRNRIVGGFIISLAIINFIMSCIVFFAFELYHYISFGFAIGFVELFQVLGILCYPLCLQAQWAFL